MILMGGLVFASDGRDVCSLGIFEYVYLMRTKVTTLLRVFHTVYVCSCAVFVIGGQAV